MGEQTFAHDMLLLMLNLSQLRDPENTLSLFLNAINSRNLPIRVEHLTEQDDKPELYEEISSWSSHFGFIGIEGNIKKVPRQDLSVIRNAIKILAIVLQNQNQAAHLTTKHEELEALITERTAELQMTKERFQSLVETTSDWIWEVDPNAVFTYVSPQVKNILGYEPHELMGTSVFSIMDPEEARKIRSEVDPFFEKQELFCNLINVNIHKNGNKVALETSGRPFFDNEGCFLGYRGIDRDITQRKQIEERFRQTAKMESIGQLAGGVAHDFNNLLGGIVGACEVLNLRIDPENEQLRTFVDIIFNAAERAATLTQQLLAFSRKGTLVKTKFDINKLLEETKGILSHTIHPKIELQFIEFPEPLIINGDASYLQNALINLAINSRDAMPSGGTLTIAAERVELNNPRFKHCTFEGKSGPYLKLIVRDTGIGITEEIQSHMFDPFYTTKGVGQGTGLGLSAVYGIVHDHSGGIDICSEVGKGTQFSIYLPALEEGAATENSKDLAHQELKGQGCVLVVDDEFIIRQSSMAILQDAGFEVLEARNGKEAVEVYKNGHSSIDIVLLDLVMPHLGGHHTFYALREINPAAKIIVGSGYNLGAGNAQELLDSGALAFIQKPYRSASLIRTLNEHLKG